MKTFIQYLSAALLMVAGVRQAAAQGTTALIYQGQLHDGGTNANGAYTMIFKLYDAVTNGNQIGGSITNTTTLANGLFTVSLDFGAAPFDGHARWLEITVTNGPDSQTLQPRVAITPSPYALYAMSAGNQTNAAGGTVTTTNFVLGSGGNSWDFSITPAGSLALAYGDPLTNIIFNPDCTGAEIDRHLHVAANGCDGNIVADGNVSANNGFTSGPWTIDSGDLNVPGIGTVSGGLRFSSAGVTRMGIDKDGNGVLISGDMQANNIKAAGDVNVDGTLYANADLHGNNADLDNIHARGYVTDDFDVTATGNMYAASFNTTSDRNLKEKIAPVDSQEILERVASLPITSWNFKQCATTRHIGPMAQDFYAAFHVGTDNKHIATVDEDGVALAAIQGLNEKLKADEAQKDARIKALEKRLADLERLLKSSDRK